MRISDIPIPEVYKESSDFRFFIKWFEAALDKVKFDTENIVDLFDPQRCPENLLWMLAETMGYKYDDRLPAAFCRLVLLYFMSMIRYKGSKSGVTLAAEVNLAQHSIIDYGKEKEILKNRLEDTSIPVNSVYVTAHTPEGYIDVVYFSDKKPIDACIEYVRPLGMYCFQHAGVAFNARNKISLDARLTNINDARVSEKMTRVGHYSRDDYARMQKMYDVPQVAPDYYMEHPKLHANDTDDIRHKAWRRNREFEGEPTVDAGSRALYSLQLSNNEHITRSLFTEPIFDLGYEPQDVTVEPYSSLKPDWNLRYNQTNEPGFIYDVSTLDEDRSEYATRPRPAVNPIMAQIGDAIELSKDEQGNRRYLVTDKDGPDHKLVDKKADEI
jgi:phage tail-like protein